MFCLVWYKLIMKDNLTYQKTYTPAQVAAMLQLSKNTVYGLINRGEIIAKRIGKVYRIPASSIAFVFTGLDDDLVKAQQQDLEGINAIEKELARVRAGL